MLASSSTIACETMVKTNVFLQRGAEGGVVERIAEILIPTKSMLWSRDRDVAQTVEDASTSGMPTSAMM